MTAWKAWAAVTEYRGDQSGMGIGFEEFARHPSIRDAPVGRRIAFADPNRFKQT
jgi:hypothetical protein